MAENGDEEIHQFFESKCNMSIKTTSKGFNTAVTCYQGITDEEIDDTVKKTVRAHNKLNYAVKATDNSITEDG